jgi:hypothetical protein
MMKVLLRVVVGVLSFVLLLGFVQDVGGVRTAFGESVANRFPDSVDDASSGDHVGRSTDDKGFRYGDRFYWLSHAALRPKFLDTVLARRVPYQDDRVTIRHIKGVKESRAVAVLVPATVTGARTDSWRLASVRQGEGADPSVWPLLRRRVVSR